MTEDASPPPRRRPWPLAFLVALRPQQWVKNVAFVGGPLLFAKSLFDVPQALRALAAVTIFCALSSAVYLWNDLIDVEKDRAHPRKRRRPIAAGELSPRAAGIAAVLLAVTALAAATRLDYRFAICCVVYLVKDLAYSLALKKIPYVDVLAIAAGFLLRVFAGALAIRVDASPFLLVCTGLVSCFQGFGKRAHERATAGDRATEQRAVLASYRPQHLRIALWVTGIATIASYVAYTLAPHTRAFFHTTKMVWTVPCVAIGVGRFLQLVSGRPKAESPTEEMLRDPLFVANLIVWVGLVIGIIYSAGH